MNNHDELMFHHSFIEADRAQRRRDAVRAWLLAALVLAMFFFGVLIGLLSK